MHTFKKILIIFLLIFALSGCLNSENSLVSESSIQVREFKVYFVVDGNTIYSKNVNNSQIFTPIEAPEKDFHKFIGWYFGDGTEFNFDHPLTEETYLYARYEPDYAALINKISTDTIKANVKIYTTSYNSFLGIPISSTTKQGSGIIFYKNDDNIYAVLTNAHVAHKENEYDKVKYEIEDFKGTKYTAYLFSSAIDISYDLAVLYFQGKETDLKAIDRAKIDPVIDENIIAIGQPEGQNNAITFGKVLRYTNVTLNNSAFSKVQFQVIEHNSPSTNGSSGGAILNTSLQLVGLQFAGKKDYNGNFISGFGIPITKINEFLGKYFYNNSSNN